MAPSCALSSPLDIGTHHLVVMYWLHSTNTPFAVLCAFLARRFSRRRTRAAAASNNTPGGSAGCVYGNAIPAVPAPAAVPDAPAPTAEKAAGSKAAELRAWQLAMLELARRHNMPQVGMGWRCAVCRGERSAFGSLQYRIQQYRPCFCSSGVLCL